MEITLGVEEPGNSLSASSCWDGLRSAGGHRAGQSPAAGVPGISQASPAITQGSGRTFHYPGSSFIHLRGFS